MTGDGKGNKSSRHDDVSLSLFVCVYKNLFVLLDVVEAFSTRLDGLGVLSFNRSIHLGGTRQPKYCHHIFLSPTSTGDSVTSPLVDGTSSFPDVGHTPDDLMTNVTFLSMDNNNYRSLSYYNTV